VAAATPLGKVIAQTILPPVLTPDVRVEDFDVADWMALQTLLGAIKPRPATSARPGASTNARATGGGLVVLVAGESVVKVLSTRGGRVPPNASDATVPLAELAAAHGVSWVLRVEREILLRFSDRWARKLERHDDLLAQVSKVALTVRELVAEGRVETYPRDVTALPIPSERVVLRALDFICPPGKTLLFGVFEGSEVQTSVALHRGERGFDRIVGPAQLRRELGLVSVDWNTSCRGLARAAELSIGPVSFGCFAQASTWQALANDPEPGAFTRAVAAREVVLHPLAPALAIPLGVDVGRAAFAFAKDFAARLGAVPWLAASGIGPALERARAFTFDGSEITRLLGFDPIAMIRELLSPEVRQPEEDPDHDGG
jgi:hypothetical protein